MKQVQLHIINDRKHTNEQQMLLCNTFYLLFMINQSQEQITKQHLLVLSVFVIKNISMCYQKMLLGTFPYLILSDRDSLCQWRMRDPDCPGYEQSCYELYDLTGKIWSFINTHDSAQQFTARSRWSTNVVLMLFI